MSRRLTAIARTLSQDGYQFRAPIIGGSMLPWFWAGDAIVVRPTSGPLVPGDVVVFERKGELVAHRLIRRIRVTGIDYLMTKGDWMAAEDAPVPPSAVIGKVVAIDRGGWLIRLDCGVGGRLMRLTGWLACDQAWLLAGLRGLWQRMKGTRR